MKAAKEKNNQTYRMVNTTLDRKKLLQILEKCYETLYIWESIVE